MNVLLDQDSLPILFLSLLALGCICALFLVRSRGRRILDAARAEAETERSVCEERLTVRDGRIVELKEALLSRDEEIERLRTENRQEAELRSRAEGKNVRLAEIEPRLLAKEEEVTRLHGSCMALKENVADMEERLIAEQKVTEEKQKLLQEAREELSNSFKALSTDIFRSNSKSFLELAKATLGETQERAKKDLELRKQSIKEMVQPLHQSLQKVDEQIRQMEKVRTEAYSGLTEQVKSLAANQIRLQGETANLVKALRTPTVRGRWGEIQLRRVVEMAGMVEYCDFIEQETVGTENGRLRPDLVIKLPGKKNIVVDSKAVLLSYLEALETDDDGVRVAKLKDHARLVRTHLTQLSSKGYWEQFQPTPEFVVLFLPGENFFSAALEQDPELIEFGVTQRVILATPTTLIALLRAVSYGWRQERITEHAHAIGEMGKELYVRLNVLAKHFIDIRKGLDRTVDSFNKAVGSYESRVLVTARKFYEIDTTMSDEIEPLETVTKITRVPQVDGSEGDRAAAASVEESG